MSKKITIEEPIIPKVFSVGGKNFTLQSTETSVVINYNAYYRSEDGWRVIGARDDVGVHSVQDQLLDQIISLKEVWDAKKT